jgi:hypothetical protein
MVLVLRCERACADSQTVSALGWWLSDPWSLTGRAHPEQVVVIGGPFVPEVPVGM